MRRATWASILAHKVRLLSTSIAIVLGVAFVTGTLILSDTLQGTFDELFGQTTSGIDVAVRGAEIDPFVGSEGVDPAVVEQIAAVEGVAGVSPEVEGFAQLIGEDGEPVGGLGPPTIGISAPVDPAIENPVLREGRFPTADGELAVDAGTAEAQGIELGEEVQIVLDGPVESFTATGIVGVGDLDNLAGATLVVLDPDTAFARWGADGWSTVYAIAEEGVDPDALRDEVAAALRSGAAAALGGDYQVETGEELADSQAADIGSGLSFLTTGLLVFAGVALFVGAFLIANTFSIIVAQRTRELALLRAVGASRRQVLGSVMAEALLTGVLGSLLGFALGAGLARGLYLLLDAFGIGLPEGDLVIQLSTFLTAVALGTVLTAVAAILPALRSTSVPPVAALQAVAAPPPPRYGRTRYALGGIVFAGGVAGIAISIAQDGGLIGVGAAAVVTLLGAAALAPLVTRPLLRLLGVPVAASRGIQGQLATENALRNPRRTAATASALMIGLALVSFVQIMATSFTDSAEAAIDDAFAGDFGLSRGGFQVPQPGPGAELEAAIEAIDGVAVATPQLLGFSRIDGEDVVLSLVEADQIEEVLALDYVAGDAEGFASDGLIVSEGIAESEGLAVGDRVEVTTAAGDVLDLGIGGITADSPLTAGWFADLAAYPGDHDELPFANLFIALEDGVDPAPVRAELDALLSDYPTYQLQDLTEVKASITDQVGQLLGLLTALLLLSVVIALLGIVNTLGLSVLERIRELGLLRAVGASRAQVRSMIRWESVLIAVLGAVFGLVLGVLFAGMVLTAIADDGLLELSLPTGTLAAGLVGAALAGVLAAVVPARRASRIDILRALEAQ